MSVGGTTDQKQTNNIFLSEKPNSILNYKKYNELGDGNLKRIKFHRRQEIGNMNSKRIILLILRM
jgi:hypothetical protein